MRYATRVLKLKYYNLTSSVSKVWSLLLIGWDSFWQLKQLKHPTSHGSPGPKTITDETNKS